MADSGPHDAAAVVVDGVAKDFVLPHEQSHTLKERVLHPFGRRGVDRLHALSDVSFAVQRGEFFGIVGRNGSGKSTLLKCMAGIYGTDRGEIHMRGRLSAFIELGVGFNPDLAARDNIVTNGIMLGLSPAEARRRVDEVIAFAELEEFADLKLKNYSSGMHVRLAFSVMIQVDADILLIDEVLAVGDAAFQQKCHDVFNRLRDEGRTILLVTHDMSAVERFCHRAVLLERGVLVAEGEPHEIALRYLERNFDSARQADTPTHDADEQPVSGTGEARAQELWVENDRGERCSSVLQGEPCVVRVRVRFEQAVEDPSFTVRLVNDQHQNAFVIDTESRRMTTGRFAPGEEAVLSARFDNRLGPGRYSLSFAMARRGTGHDLINQRDDMATVVVLSSQSTGGLVDLPHQVDIERSPQARPTTRQPS